MKDEDLILVKKDEEQSNKLVSKQDDREYLDHHVIDVTCLGLGNSSFEFTIGNKETDDVE